MDSSTWAGKTRLEVFMLPPLGPMSMENPRKVGETPYFGVQ